MDDRIKIIGYILAIIVYSLALIKTMGYLWGIIISSTTILVVSIFLKFIFKKDDKINDGKDINQNIGNKAKAKGNISFKNINQKIEISNKDQNSESENGKHRQSIGDDVKSDSEISFEDIDQNVAENKSEGKE